MPRPRLDRDFLAGLGFYRYHLPRLRLHWDQLEGWLPLGHHEDYLRRGRSWGARLRLSLLLLGNQGEQLLLESGLLLAVTRELLRRLLLACRDLLEYGQHGRVRSRIIPVATVDPNEQAGSALIRRCWSLRVIWDWTLCVGDLGRDQHCDRVLHGCLSHLCGLLK